jgi:hypothetical protein
MSAQDNGGPAFPLQSIGPEFSPGYSGMTLRDYFAAKVMQAALTHAASGGSISQWLEANAKWAYEAADAMLKARQA